MTKTHAARQLLALGPLSFGEFVSVTGWTVNACRRVLSYLVDDLGEVERLGRLYLMTNGNQLPDVHPLETKAEPGNGEAEIRPLRYWSGVDVPPATTYMQQAQTGCCGRCSREGRLGVERVNIEAQRAGTGQTGAQS